MEGAGGTQVPFRIASSTISRCRLRRTKERMTMAPETERSKTRVARKVYTGHRHKVDEMSSNKKYGKRTV